MAVEVRIEKSNSVTQPFYVEAVSTGNYKTLATSETYTSWVNAKNCADLLAAGGKVVDNT